MKKLFFSLILVAILQSAHMPKAGVYLSTNGNVSFSSDAPLEVIEASSKKLSGVLNTDNQDFLFKIPMASFEGFNSDLQKQHFNENYLESDKYPEANFSGKIIEAIDYSIDGSYTVRAKGKMTIHGVEQNTTIRGKVTVKNNKINIQSDFTVFLQDYSIEVPSLVSKKIAEEIYISVNVDLLPK